MTVATLEIKLHIIGCLLIEGERLSDALAFEHSVDVGPCSVLGTLLRELLISEKFSLALAVHLVVEGLILGVVDVSALDAADITVVFGCRPYI